MKKKFKQWLELCNEINEPYFSILGLIELNKTLKKYYNGNSIMKKYISIFNLFSLSIRRNFDLFLIQNIFRSFSKKKFIYSFKKKKNLSKRPVNVQSHSEQFYCFIRQFKLKKTNQNNQMVGTVKE